MARSGLAPPVAFPFLCVGDDFRAATTLRARLVVRVANTTGTAPRVRWDDLVVTLKAEDARTWSAGVESPRVTPGLHRVIVAVADALRLDDLVLHIERR